MRFLYNTLLTILLTSSSAFSFAQKVKTIKPEIGTPNNYPKEDLVTWQKTIDQYSKINDGLLEYEQLNTKEKELIDRLELGEGPFTQGPECSWYCGGQMYKVTGNSYLKGQGTIIYKPDNIHDFDLLTAWVPDTTNGVVGKKIDFHFKPLSPRVNEIIIYNGYIKDYDLFKANSRVKKFKLYINNVYYATLELADTTAQQSFKIDPVQSKVKQKDLILTFEIEEIYKGNKYLDVAVSEINFSGLDVH